MLARRTEEVDMNYEAATASINGNLCGRSVVVPARHYRQSS